MLFSDSRGSLLCFVLKKIKKRKNLVSEPITIIIGAPDLFVNKGSTINLTCVVKYAPEPPPMMIWSHNSEVGIISRDGMVGGRRSRFDSSRIARGQAACLLIRQFVSRFVPFRSKEIFFSRNLEARIPFVLLFYYNARIRWVVFGFPCINKWERNRARRGDDCEIVFFFFSLFLCLFSFRACISHAFHPENREKLRG